MPRFSDAPQAKKAPQERSRFCKNRSKGLGDKSPQQAKSGSKPPCLPGVKPAGFAGWQAAKRALFALLAGPFSVLQSHPIFNRGRAPAEYDQGQNPAIPYNIKIAQQIRWASIHILARPDSTMNNERVDLLRIHSQIIRMHISFLIARPCDFRPFARYAPHGYRLSSA